MTHWDAAIERARRALQERDEVCAALVVPEHVPHPNEQRFYARLMRLEPHATLPVECDVLIRRDEALMRVHVLVTVDHVKPFGMKTGASYRINLNGKSLWRLTARTVQYRSQRVLMLARYLAQWCGSPFLLPTVADGCYIDDSDKTAWDGKLPQLPFYTSIPKNNWTRYWESYR
ncbi:MAG: hypothetical protein SF123_19560 [Chloroflexota bacterium]|nr:hypothetical protein [Chloroflexota bacterium]